MAKPTDLPVWDENQLNITAPGVTQQLGGWQTTNGNIQKPPYQWINYLYNLYYRWIDEFNKQGIVEWDATTEYDNGDLTKGSDGYLYQSRIDNNVGNDPTTPSPTQWKLGLINPTLVIGADAEIGTDLQLQVVDAVEPIIELSVGQGSLRQRLTFGVDSTDATIQSFDESGPNPIPLNINTDGGNVDIGETLSVNQFSIDDDLEIASATDDITTVLGTKVTLNITGTIETGSILIVYASICGSATTGTPTVLSARQDPSGTATLAARINGSIQNRNLTPVLTNEAGTTFAEIYQITSTGTLSIDLQAEVDADSIDSANCGLIAKWVRKKLV